jgi:hypothetical protein
MPVLLSALVATWHAVAATAKLEKVSAWPRGCARWRW